MKFDVARPTGLDRQPQRSTIINRRKTICSFCGKEGQKANNRLFHPEGNPNAKVLVGPSRAAKKNAVHQPPRNIGELDDEQPHNNDDQNNSEEEGNISDTESDNGFGEYTLIWYMLIMIPLNRV